MIFLGWITIDAQSKRRNSAIEKSDQQSHEERAYAKEAEQIEFERDHSRLSGARAGQRKFKPVHTTWSCQGEA